MHRFFISPDQIDGDGVRLRPDQAHQIARVLRLRPGDAICVLDGSGTECTAALDAVSPERVSARILERRPCEGEARAHLALGLGLLKGEKMEWAVQKATEVGVAEILPVECVRSVVRLAGERAGGKAQRWQKIAQEAAEQCRRGRVPRVASPTPFRALLARAPEFDRVLLAYEGEAEPLRGALRAQSGGAARVLLLIGPEGGFAPEEVSAARAAGAVPVSFGARILRAETAAAVGPALVLYELDQ